jgi:F0F1-type ATP synthase membrane subunit b/b'
VREKDLHKSAEKILEQATQQAQGILKHALNKAEELVDKTDVFHENLEHKLTNTLKEKSTDVAKTFDTTAQDLKKEYLDEINTTFKTLEKEGKKNMEEFQLLLKQQGLSHKSFFDEKLEEEFEAAKAEIDGYKKKKMAEIEKLMNASVDKLAKQVLGKAIPAADQERLVLEALEKAKNEGMFGN